MLNEGHKDLNRKTLKIIKQKFFALFRVFRG